jgi:hypothetical protein
MLFAGWRSAGRVANCGESVRGAGESERGRILAKKPGLRDELMGARGALWSALVGAQGHQVGAAGRRAAHACNKPCEVSPNGLAVLGKPCRPVRSSPCWLVLAPTRRLDVAPSAYYMRLRFGFVI